MRLPFDEIIDLSREQLTSILLNSTPKESAKDIEDEIEDLLVMSFALGWGLLDEELQTDTPIPQESILGALESDINGKTYKEYLTPHIENDDLEGIYRVVDTEVHRMYNTGQYENAKSNGITYKTWRTMEDGKVRDIHTFLDKVKIPIDEYFYSQNDDKGLYPSGFAKAESNANCRCILSYSKE